ncbi:MAG TPA: NADP-dependent oxidoreductase [Polyangiaceae bacterium]|nr:NADP-dependent oxidoreductase [Polyangiaceae bacterium]
MRGAGLWQHARAVMQNRRIVLASRPEGEPDASNFRLETTSLPELPEGRVLVKNLYLSIDPYMRGRMSDRPSYARPVGIGEVMVGGTVGRVVESRAPGVGVGTLLVGYGGWQEYAVLNPADQNTLPVVANLPPSTALGVAGMPGATAYFGLTKIGEPKPGETVVVSAASGAVGSVVGQLAKIMGCRAVGVAGGPKKCAYVTKDLGFDACIDHRSPNMAAELAKACPKGIDVYFENVGGKVLEAVARLLNPGSRVPICGFVSQYNEADPVSPFTVLGALPNPPVHRFFLVWEWPTEYPAAIEKLAGWVREGKLKYAEDVTEGLEQAPRALIGVLRGENFGKKIIKIDPAAP